MSRARKVGVVLTGALTVGGLAAAALAQNQAAQPTTTDAKADAVDDAKKPDKQKAPKATKVEKAKKRPVESDPDLGMPAGTAYDVLCRDDIG